MIKLEIYQGTKTYVAPSGELLTPEKMSASFPAVNSFTHIIQTDSSGEICYAVQLFSAMRNQLGVEDTLTDTEAMEAMESILNAPQPEPEPTAEERIAAAMEYQNLLQSL